MFQNKYKSTVVEEEKYFLALLRYIHLNPVRAKIVENVKSPADYPWTGHRVLLGKRKFAVQDTEEVLSRLGQKAGVALKELASFMCDDAERAE